MPARALVVLLLMLNFGVATWWLLRPEPLPPTPWRQPADVPRLRLLDEAVTAGEGPAGGELRADSGPSAAGSDAGERPEQAAVAAEADLAAQAGDDVASATPAPTPAPAAQLAASASAPASPLRCMSFGPFADAGAVAAARAALQPLGAQRMRARDVLDAPRGWSVAIPPQADRAAADALATRIRTAGFDDLLVVPAGDGANTIALGRYASEPAARRREATLRAAGFPVQAQPLGETRTRHWLDVAAGPGFSATAARDASGATRVADLDCSAFIAGGAAG